MIIVAVVAALLAALLIADRAVLIYAEDQLARRIKDRGFPVKPHVSIAGFPFLTQLAARRLTKVVVSAAGRKLGPVEVKRLDLTLYQIRVSSRYCAGTALVGFAGLPGLTVAAAGPDRVKITARTGQGTGIARASSTRRAGQTESGTCGGLPATTEPSATPSSKLSLCAKRAVHSRPLA